MLVCLTAADDCDKRARTTYKTCSDWTSGSETVALSNVAPIYRHSCCIYVLTRDFNQTGNRAFPSHPNSCQSYYSYMCHSRRTLSHCVAVSESWLSAVLCLFRYYVTVATIASSTRCIYAGLLSRTSYASMCDQSNYISINQSRLGRLHQRVQQLIQC